MRRILLGNGLFEHVEIANVLKFDYAAAINVPDPYFQTVQTGTKNYSYGATAMLNNPYGASPRPNYLPPERPSWPQEQTQWYLKAMNFPQAWELIGDDDFANNPSAGFYGSANVAVIDSGLDPECDPNFRAAGPSAESCFNPDYPIPSQLPLLSGIGREGPSLMPHAQLQKNLRRMQSFNIVGTDVNAPNFIRPDVINERFGSGIQVYYTALSPQGLEANPTRRLAWNMTLNPNEYFSVGHGTHTAGLVAAAMDNVGTVGTCPSCSLNFFKRSDDYLFRNIQLASQNGVQVINMSQTGNFTVPPTVMAESGAQEPLSVFATVLNTAADSQVFLVASAGNNHSVFVESPDGNNLPASHPRVLAAGGSMANYSSGNLLSQFWSELTPLSGARCSESSTIDCGSNFTANSAKKMLYAPAAHILSTMFGTWNPERATNQITQAQGLAACTHQLYPANAQNNSGANAYPSFDSHYGMCTGTSMSAPILSGLAGLLRSVNPLLSIDDTYAAMQSGAIALGGTIPNGAVNTKQPLADQALARTLGQFGGALAQNRLIPMFAARSSVRSDSVAHVDWIYSSKPQMLRSAMLGDLYFTNAQQRWAGTRRRVNYDASNGLPPVAGYSYGSTLKGGANTPKGSFYVYASQRRPISGAGTAPLVPLYRLVTDSPVANEIFTTGDDSDLRTGACDARKHTYATPNSIVGSVDTQSHFTAATRIRCKYLSAENTATLPAANVARYSVVAIEGFIYSPILPQPKGTVALYLRYSAAVDSFALVTANDVSRPDYAGYGTVGATETVLGYVYENDAITVNGNIQTTDGDDWPANWELAMGLNADRADSDCDGVSDSVEYPLASLPLSDPRVSQCTSGNLDRYAIAARPRQGDNTEFRLRNYETAAANVNFTVEYNNLNNAQITFTPNFGNAACAQIGNYPLVWTCSMLVAPGAAGNEAMFFSAKDCNSPEVGKSAHLAITVTTSDPYQVNNYVSRDLCL